MKLTSAVITSSLVAGLLATTAQAAPTVTPAVVKAPGTVEVRFPITGLDTDASATIELEAIKLKADAYGQAEETAKIAGTRLDGGGTLTPNPAIAAEFAGCYRGGVFPNDPRTYRLDVPAKTTVTVVVTAQVPLGFQGRKAGVTLTRGALQTPGSASTSEQIIETASIERTGYVDGLSLKASKRKAAKATFTGRVVPPRSGAKITFVSRAVGEPDGSGFDLIGPALFSDPPSAFARSGLKVIGSTRTTKGGTFRATLKVPANVGVAARTAGTHAGSSCGVLGTRTAEMR